MRSAEIIQSAEQALISTPFRRYELRKKRTVD